MTLQLGFAAIFGTGIIVAATVRAPELAVILAINWLLDAVWVWIVA